MHTFRLMGPLLAALLFCTAIAGCASDTESAATGQHFGTPVDLNAPMSTVDMIQQLDALDGQTIVVEGRITQVCQNKGCWLALDNGTASPLRIDVARTEQDAYVFTVPTETHGWAVVQGVLGRMENEAAHGPARETDSPASNSLPVPDYHIVASGVYVFDMDT